MEEAARPSWCKGYRAFLLKLMLLLVIFGCGIAVGCQVHSSLQNMIHFRSCKDKGSFGYSHQISKDLQQLILVENIRQNVKDYTSRDHITGTHNNNLLRDHLKAQLKSFGLGVTLTKYTVPLSYPDWSKPNTVSLVDENNTVQYQTRFEGPEEYLQYPELQHSYLAFAPNGTANGDLVYANYGQAQDFQLLSMYNVTVNGSVVIMRTGLVKPAIQVAQAEKEGAVGVIIYTDPLDDRSHSWRLPGWEARRDTVLRHTVDQASNEYRTPHIPAHTISSDQAAFIMSNMEGTTLGADWLGRLTENVTFSSGPGYTGHRKTWKVRVSVNNEVERREISNVIATIPGAEEPDRYVIIGCHYDAWTYGAVSSGSGTAILMELARTFGQMLAEGWRPYRTVMFALWDSREQGMLGVYNFVGDHCMQLAERTVLYINLDSAVMGNLSLNVEATSLLHSLVRNVSKCVSGPTGDVLYEVWKKTNPDDSGDPKPNIEAPSTNGDHVPFVNILRVPVLWPQFVNEPGRKDDPASGTSQDTYKYMVEHVDHDFSAHEALAKFTAEVILKVSGLSKLPFDIRDLAGVLEKDVEQLQDTLLDSEVDVGSVGDDLINAVGNFSFLAADLHDILAIDVDDDSILEAREFSDKLLRVHQALHTRQTTCTENIKESYEVPPTCHQLHHDVQTLAILPIDSSILKCVNLTSQPTMLKELQAQISLATLTVQSASRTLVDDILLWTMEFHD